MNDYQAPRLERAYRTPYRIEQRRPWFSIDDVLAVGLSMFSLGAFVGWLLWGNP